MRRRWGGRQNLPIPNRQRPARSSALEEFRLDVELYIIAEMQGGKSRHWEIGHLDRRAAGEADDHARPRRYAIEGEFDRHRFGEAQERNVADQDAGGGTGLQKTGGNERNLKELARVEQIRGLEMLGPSGNVGIDRGGIQGP